MTYKIPNSASKFRYVQPVYRAGEMSGWTASNKQDMENSVYIPLAGKDVEYISLNDLW